MLSHNYACVAGDVVHTALGLQSRADTGVYLPQTAVLHVPGSARHQHKRLSDPEDRRVDDGALDTGHSNISNIETRQLATSWPILEGGSPSILARLERPALSISKDFCSGAAFNAVLLHDSLPAADSTD